LRFSIKKYTHHCIAISGDPFDVPPARPGGKTPGVRMAYTFSIVGGCSPVNAIRENRVFQPAGAWATLIKES